MRRRAFIAGLGAVASWPVVVKATGDASPVIGFLYGTSYRKAQFLWAAFLEGLASLGYVEGQNLRIELREAEGHYERLPGLAADLVKLQPALLVGAAAPAALALKAATTTIPLVFTASDDPVKLGFVASLRRPGGNATGINPMMIALEGKRLSLLHELIPDAVRIGVLFNPNSPDALAHFTDIEASGQSLGLDLVIIKVAEKAGFENAFARLEEQQIRALLVAEDPIFLPEDIAPLAVQFKVAVAQGSPAFAGAVMSYGPILTDTYRQLGVYSGRF